MLKGVSLEDIYLSDQIGNDWLIEPRILLEQKEKKSVTWEALEKGIEQQVDDELSELVLTWSTKHDQIDKQVPNKAERLAILKLLKEDRKLSLDQVMDSYTRSGHEGIKRLHEATEREASHE